MQKKQSILVIDDSQTVRRLAELVLSEEGYEVIMANDGDKGLTIAKEKIPSLIIVDFIMPKMNGFQFCKNIRSDESLNEIPIVLITSKGEDVGKGFDEKFGIVQYLKKPFETETLIKTVEEALAGSVQAPQATIEEAAEDRVPEYAAVEAETPAQMPGPKTTLPTETPFIEITPDKPAETGEQTEETILPDNSFVDIQSAEDNTQDKTCQEPSSSENPGTTETSRSAADEPVAPVYAVLQENIKSEFRHYFGQELTVLLKSAMVQSLKETDLVKSSRRILSGEVMYIPINDVMQYISISGISGKLSVLTDAFNSEVYLEKGQIAYASISRHDHRACLEDLILKDGHPQKDEILSVFSEARGSSLRAGDILLKRGLINAEELTDHYSRLSEDAVKETVSATSGYFYIEDVPLPCEIQDTKVNIPACGIKE
ncbi:MAG: response regulator [Nitrospirota bacterium]